MRIILALLGLMLCWEAGATDVSPGTDLSTVLNSSGSYRLLAGTHTVTAGFTMATNVTLTQESGATLVLNASQILKFNDGDYIDGISFSMKDGSKLQAEAVGGDTEVNGADIVNSTFRTSGTITTAPALRLGQGFNSYHRNIRIKNNNFYSVYLLIEVGESLTVSGNNFYQMTNLRPIQIWGARNRVESNFIHDDASGPGTNGGIFGISLLGKANIAADRRPCTGNIIAGNIVVGTEQEGISMDTVGNVAAESLMREWDTIATTPGSSQVTLTSGNWVAQTTYTGSKYQMIFVSPANAALAGKYYTITTHSGATFTLSIPAAEYAQITAGDGVAVGLTCYENAIVNNVIIPKLISSRTYTTGITLHGIGLNNDVSNNISYGAGSDADITNFGIREYALNGITGTDSITQNQRRGPVGNNRIYNNIVLGGGFGQEYHDYGSNPAYTPPTSSYTGTSTNATSALVNAGIGNLPDTAASYKPKAGGTYYRAGVSIPGFGNYQDAGNRAFQRPPSIGAWEATSGDSATARTAATRTAATRSAATTRTAR